MKALLYCIYYGSSRRKLPALRGVDDGPVTQVCRAGLCAAISPVEEAPLPATVERIVAYERVVEALFARRTVVPMRFGSVLGSEAEVGRHLEERGPELAERLRELAGCAEMGIRVLEVPPRGPEAGSPGLRRTRPPPPPAPQPGRAYLQARAEAFRQEEERTGAAPPGRAYAQARAETFGQEEERTGAAPPGRANLQARAEAFRQEEERTGAAGGPVAPEPPRRPAGDSSPAVGTLEAEAESSPPDLAGLVEHYRRAFQGLFTRLEVEAPTPVRLVVGPDGRPRLAAPAVGTPSGPEPPDASLRGALSLSFLVPRGRVEAFREAFARFARAGPMPVASRLSGPWPPYSFVTP